MPLNQTDSLGVRADSKKVLVFAMNQPPYTQTLYEPLRDGMSAVVVATLNGEERLKGLYEHAFASGSFLDQENIIYLRNDSISVTSDDVKSFICTGEFALVSLV